jgi:hypothetical protein
MQFVAMYDNHSSFNAREHYLRLESQYTFEVRPDDKIAVRERIF